MDPSFIPVEVVPSKTPFGLDQLNRSYKTALSATDAIAAAPAVGTADETFPFMFLMPVSTPESAESATRIDLVYMGSFTSEEIDDEDVPIMPASRQSYGSAVQSSSSNIAVTGVAVAETISLVFYAQTSELVFFTYGAPGETGTAPNPINLPVIRSCQVQNATYAPGVVGIDYIIGLFFALLLDDVIDSQEIVPGQYWQNTERKTVYYAAPIFISSITGGVVISLFSPGQDYGVFDSLSLSGAGGSASINVTAVDARGGITAFTAIASGMATASPVILDASGGSGTGASFVVIDAP